MYSEFIPVLEKLIHQEQEFEGNFDFTGRVVMGREFIEFYGIAAPILALEAVKRVREMENPDYLQVFRYEGAEAFKNQNFYVMSGFEKNTKPSDYVGFDDEFYVSVILPSER